MTLLSSLQSRIFLASSALAVLSIAVAVVLVSTRATREAEDAQHREIAAAGVLVEQIRATRGQTFMMMARLIADAPQLKAAVDTNDPPTVQAIANDYQGQYGDELRPDVLLVTNKLGQALAVVGASPRSAAVLASQPGIRAAMSGRESVSLVAQPDGMLQLVTAPIALGLANPDILGTLSVGFLMDETLALQLKDATRSEIAFGMDGQVLATTLPAGDQPALAGLLRRTDREDSVTINGHEYFALPLSLGADDDAREAGAGAVALILRSRAEHLRFLRTIHTELAATAVVSVLLATLLSFGVARTITRPMATITGVMREVAATGDLTRKIVMRGGARWDDEDARLLAATFNTLTDSVARFQREISQRERLSSLGRLSTVIAHEVRNPLMIIKTALHTLRRPGIEAGDVREAVADIDEEVRRLNRMVNDVLDFARPIQFELAPADLNAVCRESAAAAQATPGADVVLDLDPSVPLVLTDAERLRSALVNVLLNARQASRADGGPGDGGRAGAVPPVRLVTRWTGRHVVVTITDQGVGIEHADLPRVFDPYFTTRRGGTGLGLPIAKNVVEGLGGSIGAVSTPGRGTEIRIELPDADRAGEAPAGR
jgi:signal transduction histidine kinase